MKNNMMKKLLTLVLAGAMTLSLAACGAKDPQPDSGTDGSTPRGFRVAIIKQLDHASLDEIANAVAAELDQLAQTEGVKIEYEITSGQGDQTILKQLADQAIADEPTGNLDPARSLEIMLLFQKINELGTTVLIVTHEKELVNAFSKRVVSLSDGCLISDGMDGYYGYES